MHGRFTHAQIKPLTLFLKDPFIYSGLDIVLEKRDVYCCYGTGFSETQITLFSLITETTKLINPFADNTIPCNGNLSDSFQEV